MTATASEVIAKLGGKTLVTGESLTGGMIGSVLTCVPGASAVYKGGVVSYVNEVKRDILGVPQEILNLHGAVSMPTAECMARGVRELLKADFAVSVTGLAGPGGDEFGHAVGTVFIGFASRKATVAREYHFSGSRDEVRKQTVEAALQLILENI